MRNGKTTLPVDQVKPRRDFHGMVINRREADDTLLDHMTEGQEWPIVVDGQTFEVVDGQRRLEVAQKLGWTEISCTIANTFKDLMEAYKRTREFEERNVTRIPFTRMKPSEQVALMGTLRRIRRDEISRMRSQRTPPSHVTFESSVSDAMGAPPSVVSSLNALSLVLDRAPAKLSATIEGIVLDMDEHGMKDRALRLARAAETRFNRPPTSFVAMEKLLEKAERIISNLEIMGTSAMELHKEIIVANGDPFDTEESRRMATRMRVAQYRIGRLSGALVDRNPLKER